MSADLWSHRYRTYPRNHAVTTILLIWFYCHRILFSNLSFIGREAFKSRASLAKRDLSISPKGFFSYVDMIYRKDLILLFDTPIRIVKKINFLKKILRYLYVPFLLFENICNIFVSRISTISVMITTQKWQTWNRDGNFFCKIRIEDCINYIRLLSLIHIVSRSSKNSAYLIDK